MASNLFIDGPINEANVMTLNEICDTVHLKTSRRFFYSLQLLYVVKDITEKELNQILSIEKELDFYRAGNGTAYNGIDVDAKKVCRD